MGKRGPPPKPTVLKLIRGNPGHQALNKHEPQPTLPVQPPEAPEFLEGFAREEWNRIIVELYRLRLVTAVDINPLAAYCESYRRWRTAVETLTEMERSDPVTHGLIVKTQSGGTAPNPFVLIAQNAARNMVRYAAEFGLTPAARSRITDASSATAPVSKFDGLIAG